MAAMIARARNGMITWNTWSGLCHHAATPLGMPAAIEAKIISEIPLPIPRWVISSPSHISSTVPAVSEITIMKTVGPLKFSTTGLPALWPKERKRKT
jgi:hypothetical protein